MESTSTTQSPFVIPHEDVHTLCADGAFLALRSYLAKNTDFCVHHSKCDPESQSTWVLHRDLLHALIMPVVQLFKHASALAEAALCARKSEDLELAFAGDARSAFLWLQCFLSEEQDWCQTRGCPACVTLETLSTESHIRLTIAASLLSTASISSPNSSPASSTNSSPTSSAATSPISPNPPAVSNTPTQAGRTLPPLPHILPALRKALDSDPFWGPEYWSYLFSRATQLSAGIQALITESVHVEAHVSSPTTAQPPKRGITVPSPLCSPAANALEDEDQGGLRLKKSKLAKRQLKMKGEEMDLMRRCALQCWAKAAVPSKMRKELLGIGKVERRTRSLTCP